MKNLTAKRLWDREYKHRCHSDVETIEFFKGLKELIITRLSIIKDEPQFQSDFGLNTYRFWKKMKEPKWATVSYPLNDFQNTSNYSAPKKKSDGLQSIDRVDKETELGKSWLPFQPKKDVFFGLIKKPILDVIALR